MNFVKEFGAAIYCVIVTLAFFTVVILLYLKEIPPSQKDIALVILGALIASFKDVGNYFTGSTASSRQKDDTIAEIAKKGPS